jgi:hypothetical protein
MHFWDELFANESSNTSQLVIELDINELYHSREFPHSVCKNNLHVTLSSMRLKLKLKLNKCCFASSEASPKNVEKFSIEISGI